MSKKLTVEKKVEMIEEGCKLDRRIKKAKGLLDNIKKKVKKDWEVGSFATASGASVCINERDAFEDPDTKKVYNWFMKHSDIKTFLKHIKINADQTKKFIGEKKFEKMRKKKKNPVITVAFKKAKKVEVKEAKVESRSGKTRLLRLVA